MYLYLDPRDFQAIFTDNTLTPAYKIIFHRKYAPYKSILLYATFRKRKIRFTQMILESEEKQNTERLGEYFRNFRDVAVNHERTGNGRDSLFIVSEADNAENYRLLVSCFLIS